MAICLSNCLWIIFWMAKFILFKFNAIDDISLGGKDGPWTYSQILIWNRNFINITHSLTIVNTTIIIITGLNAGRIALCTSICRSSSQTRVRPTKSVLCHKWIITITLIIIITITLTPEPDSPWSIFVLEKNPRTETFFHRRSNKWNLKRRSIWGLR